MTWSVNCCGARLTGLNTAHCTTCHATFTSPKGFDRHRSNGKCLDPARMGYRQGSNRAGQKVFEDAGRTYPCWRFAGDNPWKDDE